MGLCIYCYSYCSYWKESSRRLCPTLLLDQTQINSEFWFLWISAMTYNLLVSCRLAPANLYIMMWVYFGSVNRALFWDTWFDNTTVNICWFCQLTYIKIKHSCCFCTLTTVFAWFIYSSHGVTTWIKWWMSTVNSEKMTTIRQIYGMCWLRNCTTGHSLWVQKPCKGATTLWYYVLGEVGYSN